MGPPLRSPHPAAAGALAALALACGAPPAPPAPVGNVAHASPTTGDEWTYRVLATGLAVPDSRLETYRLVRAGDRATLTVTGAESREPHDLTVTHLTAWRSTAARTFHGTVTDDAAGLRLDLAEDGTDTVWRWRCQLADYPVAPADAVIVGTGVAGCGDAGTTTAPAVPTSVLACTDAIPDADLVAGIFAFGRAPGIELFALNDDCLHGSALRHIAPDGAIGRIR